LGGMILLPNSPTAPLKAVRLEPKKRTVNIRANILVTFILFTPC